MYASMPSISSILSSSASQSYPVPTTGAAIKSQQAFSLPTIIITNGRA